MLHQILNKTALGHSALEHAALAFPYFSSDLGLYCDPHFSFGYYFISRNISIENRNISDLSMADNLLHIVPCRLTRWMGGASAQWDHRPTPQPLGRRPRRAPFGLAVRRSAVVPSVPAPCRGYSNCPLQSRSGVVFLPLVGTVKWLKSLKTNVQITKI